MKKKSILTLMLALTLALSACSGNKPAEETKKQESMETKENQEEKAETAEGTMEERMFTLEELAKYNGKDGAEAYVAIDGIVYDLSGLKGWKEGMHNGLEAGKDLSEEIQKSPHGVKKLEGLPVVGTLKK